MKKKGIFLVLGLSLVLLVLVGCTRSATTPLPPTPTLAAPERLGGGFPTPVGTKPSGGANGMNAGTATAAVAATMMRQTLGPEAGGGAVDTATPIPTVGATATPKPLPPTATPVPTKAPTKASSVPTITVPSSYTLHQGEYPYCLARRFNIDPDTLLAVNGLNRGQFVYPGTVLTIPLNAPPFPGERAWHPHPDTYTVRVGDTIYSIACYYGDVFPEAIAAANGISVNATLTPGQTLRIP